MKTIEIELYTDGACSGNPGKGGWGAIAVDSGIVVYEGGEGFRKTTNNRMEIMAVTRGLKGLRKTIDSGIYREQIDKVRVTVLSDSQLVVNTMTKNYSRNSNTDLWTELDKAMQLFDRVSFVKIKGHADNKYNCRADALAVRSRSNDDALAVDSGYEDGNKKEMTLFGEIAEETITVKSVTLENYDDLNNRCAKVLLSTGTTVTIYGYQGGFSQGGGTRKEFEVTQDIAFRLNSWLNGGNI